MKKTVSIILVVSFLASMFSIASSATSNDLSMEEFYSQISDVVCEYDYNNGGFASDSAENYETNRLIVKTETNASLDSYYGAAKVVEGYDGMHILQYTDSDQAENAYENLVLDDIEYVEYDCYVDMFDNNEEESLQTFQLTNTDSSHLSWNSSAVNVDEAFEYIKNQGINCQDVTVAVIDTGIYANHSYFKNSGRIIDSNYFLKIVKTDENEIETIVNQSSMEDAVYHGTHVSGIIFDNSMDNVFIKPYRVSNSFQVLYSRLNNALEVAIAANPDVINLSVCMPLSNDSGVKKVQQWKTFYRLVSKAVEKNIVVVGCSGNKTGTASKYYPGGIPNVITVAGSTEENKPYTKSNKGTVVDIAAPGTNIISTSPFSSLVDTTVGNDTRSDSGTSMAAPLVSAAAATLKSIRPDLSALEIQRIIKETAYVPEGWDADYGVGIVNFLNMVKAATTQVKPTITAKDGKIEMTAPKGSDSRIYYTLDGSIPTIDNHIVYTEPFSLSGVSAEMITAVCHENGKLIGEPVTTINHSVSVYYKHSKALVPISSAIKMKWSSSNPNVASVDSGGRITGIAKGTAYIHAVNENGSKFVYKVTVDYSLWQEILIKLFFGFLWYV